MLLYEDATTIGFKLKNDEKLSKDEMLLVLGNVNKENCEGNVRCLDSAIYILQNGDESKANVITNIFNELTKIHFGSEWFEGVLGTPFKLATFKIDSNIPVELSNKIIDVATDIKLEKEGKKDLSEQYFNELG